MALFYKIAIEVDKDLEDIFDYTLAAFGVDQAVIYISSFDKTFEKLSLNPQLGRQRSEIHSELRSIIHGKHVVFYRILKDHVRIVRILHGARDLQSLFQNSDDD